MNAADFWGAVSAIGTCVGALVAFLVYRNSLPKKPSPSNQDKPLAITKAASTQPRTREAAVDESPGALTLRGTTSDRKTPRELELKADGENVLLTMHPPGKKGSYQITLQTAELRHCIDTGCCTLMQRGTPRQLDFKFQADDADDIATDEVRIQLGTTSNQWWMYSTKQDLRRVMDALNAPAQ